MVSDRTKTLSNELEQLYNERSKDLLFHGWHHIYFVAKKASFFANELDLDVEIVEAAALTHDLNYLVEVNTKPEVGSELRAKYLQESGFNAEEIASIETIIVEASTATRDADISDSAKAVSDADTLFKALPITPIIFAGLFITENRIDIKKLADKVVGEQRPLMDADIYFYTQSAREKYLQWAKTNLALWENVQKALADTDVREMLAIARRLKVI